MKLRKYTENQLANALKNSTSLAQSLAKLGVAPYGGNYAVIKKAIVRFNLDISHFIGQGWNKGRTFGRKQPIERYLNNEIQIQSHKLKNRLLSEEILERKCHACHRSRWLNQTIPLELHHINGNRYDNRLDKLRLLCPNCHALTSTYRGKNISSKLSSVLPD